MLVYKMGPYYVSCTIWIQISAFNLLKLWMNPVKDQKEFTKWGCFWVFKKKNFRMLLLQKLRKTCPEACLWCALENGCLSICHNKRRSCAHKLEILSDFTDWKGSFLPASRWQEFHSVSSQDVGMWQQLGSSSLKMTVLGFSARI